MGILLFSSPISWRTPPQHLRKPSSSDFHRLKSFTYPKRNVSPFDARLTNDSGAPPPNGGRIEPIFVGITEPFFNRFPCVIYQNDGRAALDGRV
jgi:hypothetical protein